MTQPSPHRVLLVTGLRQEARIISGGDADVIVGGGQSQRLTNDLERAAAQGAGGFLSMGIAGGLSPGLRPGAVVVASTVIDDKKRMPASTTWADRLRHAIPDSISGDIAGTDRMVAAVSDKTALHGATGAVAVDMESHIVARIAGRHGIPFAALRIVADPAERALPLAAQAGSAPDGTIDVGAVIRALLASPGQIPALIRTARDARMAFRALARCRLLVGFGLCFPDLGQLPLHMP